MKARLGTAIFALLTTFMTACEDKNDTLFSGASFVLLVIVIALVLWYFLNYRYHRNRP